MARWSAERIGPTIIAAPHRGHAHVARVVSMVTVAIACVDGAGADGVASRVRASATRPRDRCWRESPSAGCARSRAADVLDEAAQKLHR